jgi:exodeoxyribonuclease VII large subunit
VSLPPSFAAGADSVVDFDRDIWTVSRLNAEVRAVLDGSFPLLWVQGEISNLSRPASGHLYFSLKDDAAQVRCAMFRFKRRLLRFEPGNGDQVLLRARVGLYEPRGDFQLIVESMEPAGEGALRQQLERLKRRLAAEGLFDEALKRPLPPLPRRIGLITSPSGAAVHDLLTVLKRRLPLLPVLIYPAQVQGAAAAESLIGAITTANRRAECDLLIIARGGGSLEDLMAFNDEGLARAIRASQIPVVTGIGHEIDLSIADLAADRRGATPSAAAELAAPSAEQLAQQVRALERRARDAGRRRLDAAGQRLAHALRHLSVLHPLGRLQQQAQRLDLLEGRLAAAAGRRLAALNARSQALEGRLRAASPRWRVQLAGARLRDCRSRLAQGVRAAIDLRAGRFGLAAAGLQARSPLATLARGYAIVTRVDDRTLVRDADTIEAGARIRVALRRGALLAIVERGLAGDE